MPADEVNNLVHTQWDNTILPAINATEAKAWNPDPNGKVVFRTLYTTRGSKSKYFAVGAEINDVDFYLRLASSANGNNSNGGTTSDQHTSSLDFSQIPTQGVQWFACATTGNNANQIMIDAADWKLENFKEVTVTCKNKDNEDMECTFWCFQCHPSDNPTDTDLVMWVQKVPSVPSLTMQKRYMVEDLGESDDFDFNDIVIDVSDIWTSTPHYVNGKLNSWTDSDKRQEAVIRHLGGILPFKLKIGDTELEEHQGVLGSNPDELYAVSGWNINSHNVSVQVKQSTNSTVYNNVVFPKAGEAPMIIAVDPTVQWMNERQCVPESWFYEP
jgi:hypothetical protein